MRTMLKTVNLVIIFRSIAPEARIACLRGHISRPAKLESSYIGSARLSPGSVGARRRIGSSSTNKRRVACLDLLRHRSLGRSGGWGGSEKDVDIIFMTNSAASFAVSIIAVRWVGSADLENTSVDLPTLEGGELDVIAN